ncbi:MAG: hypothetical protein NC218_04245, partial [Acetobacter sp.]|nr:hypothetical protein [Acetobacter sp.]
MSDKKEEDGFFVSLYKKAKSKFIEEIQQFNDMGGWSNAGEYVAQNATSVGVQILDAVGANELADDLEGKRPDIVNAGKTVDAKIAEEIQQFNDMGGWSNAGEYVAQNATS